MDIVFCTDANLLKQVSVLIDSVLFCNDGKPICFHAITLELSGAEIAFLESIAGGKENIRLTVHNLSMKDVSSLPIHMAYITPGTYLRFFIEAQLPEEIEKVLYLDVDTAVCGSLSELWAENIAGYSVAAARDVECHDISRYNRLDYDVSDSYFNAGVLLINLSWWRKNDVSKKALEYLVQNPQKCKFHDQDALNHILHGSVKFISNKYNAMYSFFCSDSDNLLIKKAGLLSIRNELENPIIIHYAGKLKPWHSEYHELNYPLGKIWSFFNNHSNAGIRLRQYRTKSPRTFKGIIKGCMKKIHLITPDRKKMEASFISTAEIEGRLLSNLLTIDKASTRRP